MRALQNRAEQENSNAAGSSSQLGFGGAHSLMLDRPAWAADMWGLEEPSGQLHRLVSRSGFVAQGPCIFLAVVLGGSATGGAI